MPAIFCPYCGDIDVPPEEAGEPRSCPACGSALEGDGESRGGLSRQERAAYEESLGPSPLEGPPPGIRTAGRLWVVGGLAGLVITPLLVVAICSLPFDGGWTGLAVVVGVLLAGFLAVVVRFGSRVGTGKARWIQVTAWLALIVLQPVIGVTAGVSVVARTAFTAPQAVAQESVRTILYLGPALFVVAVVLLAGAMVFLWQAGPYLEWRRARRFAPEPAAGPPPAFPASVRFAGWVWLLVGLVAACGQFILEGWLTAQLPRQPLDGDLRIANVLVAAGSWLVSVSFLGLLVLNGRLSTVVPISVVYLLSACLTAFVGSAFAVLVYAEAGRPGLPPAAWQFGLVQGASLAVLSLLVGLGAIAALVGGSAYRAWLRRVRGWRV